MDTCAPPTQGTFDLGENHQGEGAVIPSDTNLEVRQQRESRRVGMVFSVPALGACGPRATLDASARPAGQPWALATATAILVSWQVPQSAGAVRTETQRPEGSHKCRGGWKVPENERSRLNL